MTLGGFLIDSASYQSAPLVVRVSALFVAFAGIVNGQALSAVPHIAAQPLGANAIRVADSFKALGEALPSAIDLELRRGASAQRVQQLLDPLCLVEVEINPESRVRVVTGSAKKELVEQGWRVFLIKVVNQAGVTPALQVDSPNAGQVPTRSEFAIPRRFLDLSLYTKAPLKERLSGLGVEYCVLQVYSRDKGDREAKLIFSIGPGSADLGFRAEADILFHTVAAQAVRLKIRDENGDPAMASLLIRDALGRVYPALSKRLAPDFFFQPQVYRKDGETLHLPPGKYTVELGRGPEYRKQVVSRQVSPEWDFRLERWIDPSKFGWYSGDHHIHAAGCAHYEKPTEGVFPQDMMRHILGEDLKVGAVLSWGPGWYFQKTFFEGKDNPLSTPAAKMHYDVEVSGFPSSHTGHLVLLGLREEDYPGTKRIEDWPSWGVPVLQWAKAQGAVVGYAHSGWGLQTKSDELLTNEVPPFDGIGANEYIVSVTQGLPHFISTMDTPYPWELNIWYHTLNAGFRTRVSGETDFPCITDNRVGQGRSYVHERGPLSYEDWTAGVRDGRAYVSDGLSHLMNFAVNGVPVGEQSSEVKFAKPATVTVSANVAALLNTEPGERLAYDKAPFWSLEKARIGITRRVPVELVVNGEAVDKTTIEADGVIRPVQFRATVKQSSWIAIRILPSSHTNPIWVTVGGKPVHVARSIEWCVKAVEQCRSQKLANIRIEERGEAERAYESAKRIYLEMLKGN